MKNNTEITRVFSHAMGSVGAHSVGLSVLPMSRFLHLQVCEVMIVDDHCQTVCKCNGFPAKHSATQRVGGEE